MGLNTKKSDTEIRIGEVRFSYARVFEPNDNEKFSCCILIDKDNKEAIKLLKDAVETAAKKGAEKFWNGKIPPLLKRPLRDGDDEHPEDPTFENQMFLNASNTYQPKVAVLEDGLMYETTDPAVFYSGCYGAVVLSFFPYNTNGNKGVGVSLGNVIKLRDGERLAGTAESAESSFGDLAD